MSDHIKTWRERHSDWESETPREAMEAEIDDLREALAAANRKNLELSRVNAEQRLQEQRLEVALTRAKAAATAPIVAQPVVAECAWTPHDDEYTSYWHSSCGEDWAFIDGGPKENSVRFCHGCGKAVAAPDAPADGEA